MLVLATEKSGEENYESKRRFEVFNSVSIFSVWALLTTLILLPLPHLIWPLAIIYGLKIVGGTLSLYLLRKQFGGKNSAVDAFCKMGGKSDCDAVIFSPASKVFGFIHLSEIGALYFTGGVLSIVLGVLSTYSLPSLLFVLSASALPFTPFAIYYQGWVIKRWCPLCLAVIGVLWLEFLTHLIFIV